MCAKVKELAEKEELLEKQIQLEGENKRLWDEMKEKAARIVSLSDKLLLQEDMLRSQAELKKLLREYLQTIRSLQKNTAYLQRENKILERKLVKSQLPPGKGGAAEAEAAGLAGLRRENALLRLKLYSAEKELRRQAHVWEHKVDLSSEVAAASETVATLQRKLLEWQPAVAECQRLKGRLRDAEGERAAAAALNGALKEQLERARAEARQAAEQREEARRQGGRYADAAARLREEGAAMERFVEKSFRLEGALAELDDLSVVLKKQEAMLAVLFDENQALKEGIGQLLDEAAALKDRNWKLERYAGSVEQSFRETEKNADALHKRLEQSRALRLDAERLRAQNAQLAKSADALQRANGALAEKLAAAEQRARGGAHALGQLNEQKLRLAEYSSGNAKLAREAEHWRAECEKHKALAAGYARLPADLEALHLKLAEAQRRAHHSDDENRRLRRHLADLEYEATALRADRDRCQHQLKEAQLKANQQQQQQQQQHQLQQLDSHNQQRQLFRHS